MYSGFALVSEVVLWLLAAQGVDLIVMTQWVCDVKEPIQDDGGANWGLHQFCHEEKTDLEHPIFGLHIRKGGDMHRLRHIENEADMDDTALK